MAKHTLIRERAFVAKAMKDDAEIQRLKRQILDVFESSGRSLLKASQKLRMSQMTLRRVAQDLDMEQDLGIDRSRGEPVLLFSQARVALEAGDQKALAAIKKKIADALRAAGKGGYRGAAEILRVSHWSLKRTVEALGLGPDLFPGKYSPLGERVLVARESEDADALRDIKLEIVDAAQRGETIDAAAAELGVTPRTLRGIAASVGLNKALGFDEQKNEPVLFLARARVALANHDKKTLAVLRRELMTAVAAADGTLNQAGEALGMETAALRQAIAILGLTQEIREKFPGQGKDRPLTVRVDGRDVTHTIAEWSRVRDLNRTTIIERLKRGKSPEEAVSQGDLRETVKPAHTDLHATTKPSRHAPAPRTCKYSADHPSPKRGDVCAECRAREVIHRNPDRVCKYSATHPEPRYGDVCPDCRDRERLEKKQRRAQELKEKKELRKQPLERARGPSLFCKNSSDHAAPIKGEICEDCRKAAKPKKRYRRAAYVPAESAIPMESMQTSGFFPVDELDDFPMEELDFDPAPPSRKKWRAS